MQSSSYCFKREDLIDILVANKRLKIKYKYNSKVRRSKL